MPDEESGCIRRSRKFGTCPSIRACAPEAQDKLFRRLMRQTGFPPERFVPVDIRITDNAGVVQRIREKVEQLLQRESEKELTPEDLMGACECSQLPAEKQK
jgi:heterodisulfide reductase subunit A-like polyferredoxin